MESWRSYWYVDRISSIICAVGIIPNLLLFIYSKGVAPTERLSRGRGQEFRIESIDEDGKIILNVVSQYTVEAEFLPPQLDGGQPMLKSGEVVNLSRNIVSCRIRYVLEHPKIAFAFHLHLTSFL